MNECILFLRLKPALSLYLLLLLKNLLAELNKFYY